MGFKKKILYQSVLNSLEKSLRKPGWAKKALAVIFAVGLLFFVGAGVLLYFAVSTISNMVSEKPDIDLVALNRLIAETAIVLTEAQKRAMLSIIQELANPEIAPEQTDTMKKQLWNILDASQLQKMEAWKTTTAEKAEGLFAIPPGIAVFIEKYTGITAEMVRKKTDALLAWWQTKKPENSAEQLRETMENI